MITPDAREPRAKKPGRITTVSNVPFSFHATVLARYVQAISQDSHRKVAPIDAHRGKRVGYYSQL